VQKGLKKLHTYVTEKTGEKVQKRMSFRKVLVTMILFGYFGWQ